MRACLEIFSRLYALSHLRKFYISCKHDCSTNLLGDTCWFVLIPIVVLILLRESELDVCGVSVAGSA